MPYLMETLKRSGLALKADVSERKNELLNNRPCYKLQLYLQPRVQFLLAGCLLIGRQVETSDRLA